jgi:uncharacterized delta-60 repeat protein
MNRIKNTASQLIGNKNFRKFLPIQLVVIFLVAGAFFAVVVNTQQLGEEIVPASTAPEQIPVESLIEHRRGRFLGKEIQKNLEAERQINSNEALYQTGVNQNEGDLALQNTIDGVDQTFNLQLEDSFARVESVAVQPDGKILAGGSFQLVNGVRRFSLARLNADGTLDSTFNPGNNGPNGGVMDIELQPDGKILIGGFFNAYNGISRVRVARLNTDGSLDTTFDVGAGANSTVNDIKLQADGKILVAGAFNQFNSVNIQRIVRLNTNGTTDNTFTPPTINTTIQQLALQPDGRILIAGNFTTVGGLTRRGVARLNTNGTHDTTFDPLTNTFSSSYSVAVQPDGKIIVGSAYTGAGSLVRLNSNGSLDAGFTPPVAAGVESTVHSLIVLGDGRILVGGFLNDGFDNGYGVVSLNANGTLDPAFTPQLSDTYFLEVFSIALTPGGKLVCGGDFYKLVGGQSKHIAQLNGVGAIDQTFTTAVEAFGVSYATVRQPDGKLIVAGGFRRVNNTARRNLVRLNTDGTIDNTFVGGTDTQIFALALQPDGKILAGGQFRSVNGVVNPALVRFNADGTIDNTFVLPDEVYAATIYKIIVQPDGKILGTGLIYTPRATTTGITGIYRVNSNGSSDFGFSIADAGWYVFDAELLGDGRIYIGGGFTSYAGSGFNRIARLNANGTVDATFNTGTGTTGGANSTVRAITLQPDGRVLVGGSFTAINGQYSRGIARLNANGTQDPTFVSGLGVAGINNLVYDIFLQPDNKILIGGSFSTFNNVARTNLARLNANGSLDNAFTDQTNGYIYNINQQPDGKTLISGGFTAVNGIDRFGVARLSEADLTPPSNDNFAAAKIITGIQGVTDGNNTNATAEPGEPPHAGFAAARSIWYRWTAPDTGLYSFTTSGSSFDTTLGVYTGTSVSALTLVASNDDSASFDPTSKVIFRAVVGTTYYIAVDGKNNSTGIVNLFWRQSARTYRFYAQTGNGNISPRIPTIVARRTSDNAQFTAQNISAGVFELDLPVDNATYTVTISGADTWSPNTFTINNSSFNEPARVKNETTGEVIEADSPTADVNLVTVATTVAATVSGVLQGLASPTGVIVWRDNEGGPNPLPPDPCTVSSNGTQVIYACEFLVETSHQVKPSFGGIVFNPYNRAYAPLASSIGNANFATNGGATYNVTGQVRANGNPLNGATVLLTGSKTHSFVTTVNGNYAFNNLPNGGTYTFTVLIAGYNFTPQTITNLQASQTLNFTATGGCAYTLSPTQIFVGAGSSQQNIRINTTSGCPWTVSNSAPWITINSGLGNGTGDMYFTIQPNNGAARSTVMTVAGQQLAVVQASGCTFSFSGGTPTFPASGGANSVTVTPSDAGCTWTATASDYCMISGLSGGGAGGGPVNYIVSSNPGVARTAQIRVGDQTFTINQLAAPGVHRARYDYDGDGRSDINVFRPSTNQWYILGSQSGIRAVGFGSAGDKLTPADYDGDGRTDVAVYRPSTGFWYWMNSSNGAIGSKQFGVSGDIPIAADFDGDGRADLGLYRPSNGYWFIFNFVYNTLDYFPFGATEDKPLAADYDGDGKADAAVFRPSNGTWYLRRSAAGIIGYAFGSGTDKPVPADYDGNGQTDIAVYRSGIWYILQNLTTFRAVAFGAADDVPVPTDYNGDKSADIAVYRPSSGGWYVWSCSNNAQFNFTYFGASTDVIPQSGIQP